MLFPFSLCASAMPDSLISIQMSDLWIISDVLGLFSRQIQFKRALVCCAVLQNVGAVAEWERSRAAADIVPAIVPERRGKADARGVLKGCSFSKAAE